MQKLNANTNDMCKYTVIRSNRKSVAIQIKDNAVIVRAPFFVSKKFIDDFVISKENWINSKLNELSNTIPVTKFTFDEMKFYKIQFSKIIYQKVKRYAEIIGVDYQRISLKSQKTLWGSCSKNKNLNFNYLLILFDDDIINSVVVHELCHLIEFNHSKQFYAYVYKYCLNYDNCKKVLKEKGSSILSRIP